jgi:hypothetical protein
MVLGWPSDLLGRSRQLSGLSGLVVGSGSVEMG